VRWLRSVEGMIVFASLRNMVARVCRFVRRMISGAGKSNRTMISSRSATGVRFVAWMSAERDNWKVGCGARKEQLSGVESIR